MKNQSTLPSSLCITYALPHIAMIWLISPLGIAKLMYAKHYGVPLTTIAVIIVLGRLFDSVSDLLIGYYSDRYYQRTGSRKPFMLAGGLLLVLSAYFFYVPVSFDALMALDFGGLKVFDNSTIESPKVSVFYFAFWLMAFYASWTLIETSHLAWASHLAPTSADKTKIFSVRGIVDYLGRIVFFTIPLLPFFATTEITPASLQISTIAAILVMLPCLYFSLTRTPDAFPAQPLNKGGKPSLRKKRSSWRELRSVLEVLTRNTPYCLLVGAYFFAMFGAIMWYSLIFLYVDSYLGLGEQFAQMFLLATVLGITFTPVVYKLSVWFGKKTVWIGAAVLLMTCFIYTGTLAPGNTGFAELVILKSVHTLSTLGVGLTTMAMVSEAADYGAWKFRSENNGLYFSVKASVVKASGAFAAGVGMAVAGWFGFDPAVTTQTEDGIFGLKLVMVWLPFIFLLLSLTVIVWMPLNERRHAIIRRSLDARAIRAKRTPPPAVEKENTPQQPVLLQTS